MAVRIKFLGGARTVTGSSHQVLTEKSEILLDSGLFQGHRDESYQINTTFNYNPRKINALILSHAHIDHCGNLPSLIKKGLRCKIYATSATKDLCKLMLEDSGKIQEEDIKYVNKINRRLGLPLRKPLYTSREASKAVKKIHPVSYGQRICVTSDVAVTLFDAGHILGSSLILLEIKDLFKTIRLGYAVDLGRKGLPILNDPDKLKGLDYLIMESTYGARLHAPIEEAKVKLKEVINRTVARKGKILIPSFTLERTQEVIYFLNELLKEKSIPEVPIYVDSPLACDITDAFQVHPEYMDKKTSQAINKGETPFEFLNLRYIRDQNESKTLNNDKRPMIIIAGSGMCESGRILHHLKNNIEDSRNTVLVVGFMARDTLGRRIVEGERFVRIFGVEYELNAEVIVINAFSGHADKNELIDFVSSCLPLRRIFLVHGEEEQLRLLSESLTQMGLAAYIPSKGEEVLLD
ncbi:MAG: MBL fold metallo-hydrolase [Candidatus Omnitrophica bacterium]|nr:MBL fold metallo-hydrolase [Candidatus Omnitrophota bacterium]